MYLLKFFLEWGKYGLGFLWVLYAGLSAWFLYQMSQQMKKGGTKQSRDGIIYDNKKTPFYKTNGFKLWLFLTSITIIIHFMIHSDYK